MFRKACVLLSVCILATSLAACSTTDTVNEANPAQPKSALDKLSTSEPITLKVWEGLSDDAWNEMFVAPIKAKFPNVTLEPVILQKNTLEKLIATGNIPDILYAEKNQFYLQLFPTKLEYDLTDLIKKYSFDLGKFSLEYLNSMKSVADKDQIYGFPMDGSTNSLVYNKAIFDKFAVPYPKDNMTWDEAIELARRVTRAEGGVQYHGLAVQNVRQLSSQLNLEEIDRNGKANLSRWTKPAALWKQIYDIPGNDYYDLVSLAKGYQPFYEGTLAMLSVNPGPIFSVSKEMKDLQWDIVTVPTFPEAPNIAPYMTHSFLSIAPGTKYKEEAFKVIAYLVSDEAQTAMSRKGHLFTLDNPAIKKQFFADRPDIASKNLQSIFLHKQSDPYYSVYMNNSINSLVRDGFVDIARGKGDINTILRNVDEAIDKNIAEQKSK